MQGVLLSGEKVSVSGGHWVPGAQGCSTSVAETTHTQYNRPGPALAAPPLGGSSPPTGREPSATEDTLVRRARPPHSRKQEPPALGDRGKPVSDHSCPIPHHRDPYPTCLAPGSPGVPIVARGAELAVGTLSVVLAEAEPAEVVTVAAAWVPVLIALAGSAAA